MASVADFLMWCTFLVVTEAVVFLARRFWKVAGELLSETSFRWGLVRAPPLGSRASMAKWLEQSWQLTVHFFFALCEFYLIFVAERNEGLPKMWDLSDIEANLWVPRPWGADGQPMDVRVRVLYVAELAVWIYTAGMHVFYDKRRKDYQAMLVHHVVTIGLIAGSFSRNYTRIGLLVLYVNDATDIFVDWLKMANYLKLRGPEAFFLAEASFMQMVAAFAYFRIWHHPFRINYWGGSSYDNCPPEELHNCDPDRIPLLEHFFVRTLVGGLWVLTGLHVYWFFLMLRIIWTILTKDAETASREEYEGDSDDEEGDTEEEGEYYLFTSSLRKLFRNAPKRHTE
jgi:ceramide synthetase